MRRLLLVVLLCCIFAPLMIHAQADGVSVTCDFGASFENGIEVIMYQMNPGATYRVTAIGIGGFDPVLAVINADGEGTCSDDEAGAATYTADLPTTGRIAASNFNSQVTFDQNGTDPISLIVGGLNSASGEFVLVLEGMELSAADSPVHPYSIRLTSDMVESGVPLSVYMLSADGSLDSLLFRADGELGVITDADGNNLACDDAGNPELCFGDSAALTSSSITTADGQVRGAATDAMLSLSLGALQLSDDPDMNFFNYALTSYNQETEGAYVVAFHMGTERSSGGTSNPGGNNPTPAPTRSAPNEPTPTRSAPNQPTPAPTQQQPPNNNGGSASGLSVTCDNGTSFDNGVEVIVNQMRSGFTYTATAIGVNGFDPVLAVISSTGAGACSDDTAGASRYAANLPSINGSAPASGLSAQVTFDQNSAETFADVSLVVGGSGNTSGEFILVLEGMAVTPGDGAGDAFSVLLTPGLVNSGVPLTVYMLTRGDGSVDPLMYLADTELNVITDNDGNEIYCDDAGNPELCYGESVDLSNSTVTINTGSLPGWQYDAMLYLPIAGLELSADPSYFHFVMTSYQQQTQGQYLLVFHGGIN